mgnify:CR=1 FL=1
MSAKNSRVTGKVSHKMAIFDFLPQVFKYARVCHGKEQLRYEEYLEYVKMWESLPVEEKCKYF